MEICGHNAVKKRFQTSVSSVDNIDFKILEAQNQLLYDFIIQVDEFDSGTGRMEIFLQVFDENVN